ncbi:MAG: hypothetical protein ACFFCS_27855 [Candidatus Hodarchaeota archaeon]
MKSNRSFVGYEINEEYRDHAMKRIKKFMLDLKSPTLMDFK